MLNDGEMASREIKHVKLMVEVGRLENTRDQLKKFVNDVLGKSDDKDPTGKPLDGKPPIISLAETLETAPGQIAAVCDDILNNILQELKSALF